MTETEWQEGTDPERMLAFLHRKASDRKLRLFACACCRMVWEVVSTDRRSALAVEVAERCADWLATQKELAAAGARAYDAASAHKWAWQFTIARYAAIVNIRGRMRNFALEIQPARASGLPSCDLLREIMGNPIRPTRLDPSWITADVTELAGVIYNDRAFDRAPILADALEEAGCTDEAILGHLRSPGPHYRGCFAADAVLGKS